MGSKVKIESKTSIGRGSRRSSIIANDDKTFPPYDPYECYVDPDYSVQPEFIYGGPFIKSQKPDPFLDTTTPVNLQLSGCYKKSNAYSSLKDRMPVILTKIIDRLSREGGGESTKLVAHIAKLKNDLVTNKRYAPFEVDTAEAKRWNQWITECEAQTYFTNSWVFTECYIYRKIREGCELVPGFAYYDPFSGQKHRSFFDSVDVMCQVADKFDAMLEQGDMDKRKADFITLVKLCLWSNKCDLSLSAGEPATLKGFARPASPSGEKSGSPPAGSSPTGSNYVSASPSVVSLVDPFQMILDCKDKLLVDDAGKAYDAICSKAQAKADAIDAVSTAASFKQKCSCDRLATAAGLPVCQKDPAEEGPASPPAEGTPGSPPGESATLERPKIPCPAKITVPSTVFFDIVCDNAGYELFCDLCLARFMIVHKIVEKVRFHVKKIPWFISDVTDSDFKFVIDSCSQASVNRTLPADPAPAAAEEEAPPEPKVLTSDALRNLGSAFSEHLQSGEFIVLDDDFWTSPHVYKDMKRYDSNLYRKLQLATAIFFKGDLNYRKLLGERNVVATNGFEPSLQGFIPAPILAARTVKSDLICGLPKGKKQTLDSLNPEWMNNGDYGVIHFCGKAEALKISDRPCVDYGEECRGVVCPVHTEL